MDKIIEYIKSRKKDLEKWSNGLDDGTYSSATETYDNVIRMLEENDNDAIEIITHTYYADGKAVRIETDYKYKNN